MTSRFASLQAVRALAASMIVVVHLAGPTAFEHKVFDRSLLQPLWYPAMTGVDIFFVVSGFVMALTAGGGFLPGAGRPRVASFVWRRVSRVYPMYWAVSGALLAVVLVAPTLMSRDPGTSLVASFLLLPQSGEPLLLVGWTLVHEMGFYVVFTLALVAGRFGGAVLGTWGVLVLAGSFVEWSSPWLEVATSPLNLEFLLGVAAGALVLRRRGHGSVVLFVGLTVLAVAWVDKSLQGPFADHGLIGALVVGTGAALAVAGLARLEQDGRLRVPALFARLGDASYSLYLVHVLVVTAAAIVAARVLPDLPGPAGVALQLLVVAAVFVGCQVAGLLAHALVERPLLRLARRVEAVRPQPTPERSAVSEAPSTLTT